MVCDETIIIYNIAEYIGVVCIEERFVRAVQRRHDFLQGGRG